MLRDRNRGGQRPRRHGRAVLRSGVRVRSDAAVAQVAGGASRSTTSCRVTLLFLAVWWVWMYTAWTTNWLDPEQVPVRVCLFLLTSSACSCRRRSRTRSRSAAWCSRSHMYRCKSAARCSFCGRCAAKRQRLASEFSAHRVWLTVSGVFWIVGAFAEPDVRLRRGGSLALGIEMCGPWALFWVPGLGRSPIADWDVDGGHMAERCALFIIIALGESLLVTGATFAELTWDASTLAAFFSAVVGSILMWWIYFDTGARARGASHRACRRSRANCTLRIYLRAHRDRRGSHRVRCRGRDRVDASRSRQRRRECLAILGGPACYLLGAAWFKWVTNDRRTPPLSHMVGLATDRAARLAGADSRDHAARLRHRHDARVRGRRRLGNVLAVAAASGQGRCLMRSITRAGAPYSSRS